MLHLEDSDRDAELTLDALGQYNLINKIERVRDGAEALDYLRRRGRFSGRPEGSPSVMLLDLKMPKVDGIEVLRQVKGDPELKLIPVVVMTSSREDKDLLRCYDLGANAYVVKPVHFTSFVDAVKQIGAFWAVVNEPPPPSRP